tara:strand:- start:53 stop:268 length:216 start_codon:yes stop_codon:yes gene_type:complete
MTIKFNDKVKYKTHVYEGIVNNKYQFRVTADYINNKWVISQLLWIGRTPKFKQKAHSRIKKMVIGWHTLDQ